ncbi:MAG: C39 family peptidase [Corynebacterium sp.]|nr:C39 family peptidase [Corynebacterium sp.]
MTMGDYEGILNSDGLNSLFDSEDFSADTYETDSLTNDDLDQLPDDPFSNPFSTETDPSDPQDDYVDPGVMEPELPADEPEEPQIEDPTAVPEEDGVYGSSYEWNGDWLFQQVDGYCGPTSAAIIVNEYHDAGIADPQYMVNQAYEMGLTEDISQGMYMHDVQTLLENSGVPCEQVTSSMDDLANRLEQGYGVIAFVDSGELWGDQGDAVSEDNMPDHFLVVTEINTNTGMVTLADPGNPNGNGMQIPISEFEDAWADSNYEMVATTTVDSDLAEATGGAVENPQLAIANVTRGDVIQ